MESKVNIIGAGLAGSEAALQLADRGVKVRLFEMRPEKQTAVHRSGDCAELVCSNSLKSTKPDSAAGMLKFELETLGSRLIEVAFKHRVAAGGALAVDREAFADEITSLVQAHPLIEIVRKEVVDLEIPGDATIVASGPLTSERLVAALSEVTGAEHLSFYDAAAPIVMADSLDQTKLFRQSRYEEEGLGDYLNAPFDREEYEAFIQALVAADRVVKKDFETRDLFQACQPIEEIARKGSDAPRFGALKPVGLSDPKTGRRPWAVLQLRAEDTHASSFNLVGFQTNLTFSEQARVFRMIPGLKDAEFARYGVMHRNTFIDAPRLLRKDLSLSRQSSLHDAASCPPIFFAGQLSGTEGYCEAIMSGLIAALGVHARLSGVELPEMPNNTAFGALLAYATNPETFDYQPMHVNFGLLPPLDDPIKNKKLRYERYMQRGHASLAAFAKQLSALGLMLHDEGMHERTWKEQKEDYE